MTYDDSDLRFVNRLMHVAQKWPRFWGERLHKSKDLERGA